MQFFRRTILKNDIMTIPELLEKIQTTNNMSIEMPKLIKELKKLLNDKHNGTT